MAKKARKPRPKVSALARWVDKHVISIVVFAVLAFVIYRVQAGHMDDDDAIDKIVVLLPLAPVTYKAIQAKRASRTETVDWSKEGTDESDSHAA